MLVHSLALGSPRLEFCHDYWQQEVEQTRTLRLLLAGVPLHSTIMATIMLYHALNEAGVCNEHDQVQSMLIGQFPVPAAVEVVKTNCRKVPLRACWMTLSARHDRLLSHIVDKDGGTRKAEISAAA
jgi:hypothetical protein